MRIPKIVGTMQREEKQEIPESWQCCHVLRKMHLKENQEEGEIAYPKGVKGK